MLKDILEFLKDILELVLSIKNLEGLDGVIVGLIIATISLFVSHLISFFSYRGRLKDKDKMIDDLVKQRNKLQDALLNTKIIRRKSTKK